jgi:hypothetical protein
LQALLGRLLPNFAKPGRAEVPDVSGATPTTVTVSPPAIANESETPIELTRASSDSTLWVFASNAICFVVGSLDSKVRTFCYEAGTAVPFSKTGKDDGWTWYQVPGNGGKDLWLRGYDASTVYADDKRVFCRIAETGHVGYLVEIWGDRNAPHGSIDEIRIVDHLLGYVQIKSDQIVSIVAKQGEMSVKTKEAGDFAGELQKLGNYSGASFTMGPCLVTGDAVIALVRTKRPHPLTLQRIAEGDRPRLVPERFYWERSQLKFRIAARAAVGHFDESVCDGHIHFVEQSLGWMRISIPQIKKLTVDAECRDAPIAIETFVGNVYRGVCPERFNLSGTMISFDKIKNLVLEAFNRDSSSH